MTLLRLLLILVAAFATISHLRANGPLELTLISPSQETVEDNGFTTTKPLLIMPCKGATAPKYSGDGEAFLVFRNISPAPVQISLRNPAPVLLTFYTPNGTEIAKRWSPLKYTCQWTIPACYGQFLYTLKPGEIRVCPINFFRVPRLVNDPFDWMAVYSTSRVLIECRLQLSDDERVLKITSGWLPIAVHEPDTDQPGKVPNGSILEAAPSCKAGYPPTFIVHPRGQ